MSLRLSLRNDDGRLRAGLTTGGDRPRAMSLPAMPTASGLEQAADARLAEERARDEAVGVLRAQRRARKIAAGWRRRPKSS